MAQNQKSCDNEFKSQAVKLAQEIGGRKAAKEENEFLEEASAFFAAGCRKSAKNRA